MSFQSCGINFWREAREWHQVSWENQLKNERPYTKPFPQFSTAMAFDGHLQLCACKASNPSRNEVINTVSEINHSKIIVDKVIAPSWAKLGFFAVDNNGNLIISLLIIIRYWKIPLKKDFSYYMNILYLPQNDHSS